MAVRPPPPGPGAQASGGEPPPAAEAVRRTARRLPALPHARWLGPLAALVALYLLFALLAGQTFATLDTLRTMIRQTTMVGLASLGMTIVIILGGIDLSIGSIVALVTVVIAMALSAGIGPVGAALIGVAAAGLCGLMNGAIIAGLRVQPFIVTLGAMGLFRGIAKGLAHEQKVDAPVTWLNRLLEVLGPGQRWEIVPPGVWVLIVLTLVVAAVLHYTRFGRHVFAIGSNELTARVCGIRIGAVKLAVYTVSSLLVGVAGVMQFARLSIGDPTVAVGFELDAIAAVVIGGGSLNGGEGSIAGTLIGAMLMTEIRTGCTHLGLSTWIQEIITGLIIVLAVMLDRLRHRRAG
jgi:ribose/xylose/arabinose/galactoside ABC-type transport system permease subunit